MSVAITQGIRIEVASAFVPNRSSPELGEFFFAYHVVVENRGDATVQLLSRHWVIRDGNGRVEEVRGAGVVGKQPVLRPGESFEYTSACPLPTPYGTMHGTYEMASEDGSRFDASIAPFELSVPADSRTRFLN